MECNAYPSLGATQSSLEDLFHYAASPSSAHPYLSHTILWRWNALLIHHSTSRITAILSNSAASHSIALPSRCLVQTWYGYSPTTFSPEELVHCKTHFNSSFLIHLLASRYKFRTCPSYESRIITRNL